MALLGTRGWDRKAWKYGLADLLNWLPRTCWTGLVFWVEFDAPLCEAWSSGGCRRDMEALGNCYCGKLKRRESGQP